MLGALGVGTSVVRTSVVEALVVGISVGVAVVALVVRTSVVEGSVVGTSGVGASVVATLPEHDLSLKVMSSTAMSLRKSSPLTASIIICSENVKKYFSRCQN